MLILAHIFPIPFVVVHRDNENSLQYLLVWFLAIVCIWISVIFKL